MARIIRVFPRRTAMTPRDEFAFVGDPPLLLPDADEVHISVSFTWDITEANRLQGAWRQHYKSVKIGGPALQSGCNGFMPGLYITDADIDPLRKAVEKLQMPRDKLRCYGVTRL